MCRDHTTPRERLIRMAESGGRRRLGRRTGALAALLLGAASLLLSGCGAPTPTPTKDAPVLPLREAAGDRIRVGTAVEGLRSSQALKDSTYARILGTEFSSVTPENQMKWAFLQPTRGTWDFAPADEVVGFATKHGQTVRGHTLIWHGGNPSWVSDAGMSCEAMRQTVRTHITTVVKHYRGRVAEWDVANELLDENGRPRPENPFVRACGMGIVDDAFRWARAADPDAKLFLNDYGAEAVNARSDAYVELIRGMKARGVPIDGFGVQAHLRLKDGVPKTMGENLARFAHLGLKVAITEADVRLDWHPGEAVSSSRQAAQARAYAQLVKVCVDQPACTSFTVWGFTDRYSWLPEGIDGQGYAALMTDQYTRKPAFDAVARALYAGR